MTHILPYSTSSWSKSMNINHVAGYIIPTHSNQAFIRFKSTEVISSLPVYTSKMVQEVFCSTWFSGFATLFDILETGVSREQTELKIKKKLAYFSMLDLILYQFVHLFLHALLPRFEFQLPSLIKSLGIILNITECYSFLNPPNYLKYAKIQAMHQRPSTTAFSVGKSEKFNSQFPGFDKLKPNSEHSFKCISLCFGK